MEKEKKESEKWYYFYEDIPYGPLSAEEISNFIKAGTIPETILVHKGIPSWKTAKESGLVKLDLAIEDLSGCVYPLSNKMMKIGRAPDNDIVISIPSVSRYHAQITRDETGVYWIENLKSKAGIIINGNKIDKAKLDEGTELQLGKWVANIIRWDKNKIQSQYTIFEAPSQAKVLPQKQMQESPIPLQQSQPSVTIMEKTGGEKSEIAHNMKGKQTNGSNFIQICPACNNKLPATAIFCGFCGTNLKKSDKAVVKESSSLETTCIKCNKKINKNATFCPYCGEPKIQSDKKESKSDETIPIKKCPNCNKEILETSKFCGFCGTKLL